MVVISSMCQLLFLFMYQLLVVSIRFGCQKVALKFLIGKLHKAVPILFRCPKIRKSKSACVKFSQSDVYVLNVPSMGH